MTIRSNFFNHIAKTSPFPLGLEISKAKGAYVMDENGKAYLDFISGIGVSNLGHGHPDIIKAIHTQADLYLHTMVYGEHIQSPQVLLAQALCAQLPDYLNQVYFLSSGTEAIETAMKMSRKITNRTKILSFENAYHGSSFGSMSLMSDQSKTMAYAPMLPDIDHLVFNNFESLQKIDETVAAIIIEVIQAEAGIILPDVAFLNELSERCKKYDVLLVIDEIQTGMGRTGSLFAFSSFGLEPDILVLGKSVGGGLPLSACISSEQHFEALAYDPPLTHMTTFGGHPLCCAAGLAALQVLLNTDIINQSINKALQLSKKLIHPTIKEIRSTNGLWMAIDLDDAGLVQKLIPKVQEDGLLLDWFLFNDQSIRIAPPLNIKDEEIDQAADILLNALDLFSE
ncbi:MAG: aspartate aminotransferase family protein [Saprospiraceae bacterium]